MPTVNKHCTCGASFSISTNAPASAILMLMQGHTGQGHEPCDAATASAARRKSEHEIVAADRAAESEATE